MADLERAIIDSLYFPRYCPISEVFLALKNANMEKLMEYASKLNVEAVNRRFGYMLDILGIKNEIKIKGKSYTNSTQQINLKENPTQSGGFM